MIILSTPCFHGKNLLSFIYSFCVFFRNKLSIIFEISIILFYVYIIKSEKENRLKQVGERPLNFLIYIFNFSWKFNLLILNQLIMDYNILGYGIFISIIVFIIVVVGKICYRNGNIFVAELIPDHLELCQQINKSLLVAYYLVNIGYASMTLIGWETITSSLQLIEIMAVKVATIICLLSVLHYLNIFLLTNTIHKLIK